MLHYSIVFTAGSSKWKQVETCCKRVKKRWHFPHCIRATDENHVEICKLPGTGSYYFNYKHLFNIVLMGIVNANYKFLMVDVGANGRVSDGGVFSNTMFCKSLN